MKVSGFTYIRNGFKYDYPFQEAFRSILPLCDELVVAVGDSEDDTRQAVQELAPDKVKIINTVWDDSLREGGQIFAQQANIALDHISGDWGVHIQADEVMHEKTHDKVRNAMEKYLDTPRVQGFVFPFLHFYGDYWHYASSRDWYRREVRVIRNDPRIFSYKDSQGFRYYKSKEHYESGAKGRKLRVKLIDDPIFHYSYARHPKTQQKQQEQFHKYWHDDEWVEKHIAQQEEFDYSKIDEVTEFTGTHPDVMKERVRNQDWEFENDPNQGTRSLKKIVLGYIEKKTGWRIGEYQNYKLI